MRLISCKKLISPEFLFSIAYCTVLITYLSNGWGTLEAYKYDISYYAIRMWTLYYLFFLVGTLIGSFYKISKRYNYKGVKTLNRSVVVSLICMIVLYIWNIHIYIGFPAIKILLGEMSIEDVNTLSDQSPPLVLGLTTACLSAVTFLVIYSFLKKEIATIISSYYVRIVILLSIYSLTFICFKRQGAVMCTLIIITTILFQDKQEKTKAVCEFFFGTSKNMSKILILISLTLSFIFFGAIGTKRSQQSESESTISNIERYYSIAYMNFDTQTQYINLKNTSNFLPGPLSTLLPYKILLKLHECIHYPDKLEATSPSGFWEYIQWFWGYRATCITACFIGIIVKVIFRKAKTSLIFLGAYSLIPWMLISAPLYNHFFNANYFFLPTLLIFIFIQLGRVKVA